MSLKIILLDDDETTIYIHKMMVKASQLSAEPLSFMDSKATLNYLDKHYQDNAEDSYLILLDINMPGIDGWGFLDAIQSAPFASALSIVVVTSSIDNVDKKRAAQYKQVVGFVEKPLSIEWCGKIMRLPQLSAFFGADEA